MRYSPEHKVHARKKIVESAGMLAKKAGFGASGVDALMQAAGMTGGAFYKHFETKEDLLRDILAAELERSRALFQFGDGSAQALAQVVKGYMSLAHVNHPDQGCILPALSAEVAHASADTKALYEQGIQELHSTLGTRLGDTQSAWALMAMAVGAVMMARAVESDDTRKALLKACQATAMEWLPEADTKK